LPDTNHVGEHHRFWPGRGGGSPKLACCLVPLVKDKFVPILEYQTAQAFKSLANLNAEAYGLLLKLKS